MSTSSPHAPSAARHAAVVEMLIARVARLERDYGRLSEHTAGQERVIAQLEHARDMLSRELEQARSQRAALSSAGPLDHRATRWLPSLVMQLMVLARATGLLEGDLALRDAEVRHLERRNRALQDGQRAWVTLSVVAFVIGVATGMAVMSLI